jgi:hypothetical protein
MANFVQLTLDTTAPASPTVLVAAGATLTSSRDVTVTIGTGDGVTTGYQMKLWGDVDNTYDTNVQATEAASQWITYATSKAIRLSAGDGAKNINLKVRDDVWNSTTGVVDGITLDMTVPTVTTGAIDVSKVSEQTGKDKASFSFTVDGVYEEYKVKLVSGAGAVHTTGTQIPTAGGSTNVSGAVGNYVGATPITVTIDGTDLKAITSDAVGLYLKVFVRDAAGNWSV